MNTKLNQSEKAEIKADVMQTVLQASDLRVGNLINVLHPYTKKWNIEETKGKTIMLLHQEKEHYLLIQNLKPIPLTEEWLLKFGFEETMKWTFKKELIGNNFLVYYLGEKGVSIGFKNYSDFPCKYIHQLQNLFFVLTGAELTVA